MTTHTICQLYIWVLTLGLILGLLVTNIYFLIMSYYELFLLVLMLIFWDYSQVVQERFDFDV